MIMRFAKVWHICCFLFIVFIVGHISSCGLALEYLKQPLDSSVALQHMYLLMGKQRNRGQDGAGLALITYNNQYVSVKGKSIYGSPYA